MARQGGVVRELALVGALFAAGVVVFHPAAAWAAPGLEADAGALLEEVDRDYADTLASDCSTACRALDSMRRSVERLCAMDPGDRCLSARAKLAEATRHVRASCPLCEQTLDRPEPATAPPPPPPTTASNSAAYEEAAPEKRGGCASCATATTRGDAGWVPSLAAALFILLRHRRKKKR
jgi:MYXO-CTERM domain-containing protein